jgi:hypothetical protein
MDLRIKTVQEGAPPCMHMSCSRGDLTPRQPSSRLYNRAEYRRLFPPQYGESAHMDRPHPLARALWGQFLHHSNRLNEEVAARFLARLADLRAAAEYPTCFPYPSLLTQAPIHLFYAYYGLGEPC